MKKVLLIENNLILSSRISSAVKAEGYELKVAQGQPNLEALLGDFKPDMVLINLELPQGVELVRKLKESFSEVPVVGYCGHKNLSLQEDAKGAGADLVVPNSAIASQTAEILSRFLTS